MVSHHTSIHFAFASYDATASQTDNRQWSSTPQPDARPSPSLIALPCVLILHYPIVIRCSGSRPPDMASSIGPTGAWWLRGGCATKHEDDMEERSTISTPMASTREAMNRWAVAPGGCKPGVKELALKGPLRCDAGHQDGRAWLRGRRVSPPEADGNPREKAPLPRHPARWGSERTRKDSLPWKGCHARQSRTMAETGYLVSPVSVRDPAERGMG
jgi:hypothetical protein